jgi:hypothetical protein
MKKKVMKIFFKKTQKYYSKFFDSFTIALKLFRGTTQEYFCPQRAPHGLNYYLFIKFLEPCA